MHLIFINNSINKIKSNILILKIIKFEINKYDNTKLKISNN